MVLPRMTENPRRAHGRYGAKKFKMPKKFMRMYGLRRDHTYTSIIVKAWPKNSKLMKKAKICNTNTTAVNFNFDVATQRIDGE